MHGTAATALSDSSSSQRSPGDDGFVCAPAQAAPKAAGERLAFEQMLMRSGAVPLRRLELGDRTLRSEEGNAQVFETRGLEDQAVPVEFVALEDGRVARQSPFQPMRTVIEGAIWPGLNEVALGAEGRDGDGIEEEAARRDRLSGLEWEELGWFDDPESLGPGGSGRD